MSCEKSKDQSFACKRPIDRPEEVICENVTPSKGVAPPIYSVSQPLHDEDVDHPTAFNLRQSALCRGMTFPLGNQGHLDIIDDHLRRERVGCPRCPRR